MPDTPEATETVETPTVVTEPKTFSEDYVKQLREEAAAARVGKKDAVDQAKTETRAEVIAEYEPRLAERDTKIAELTKTNTEQSVGLLKLNAVLEAKVPSEDVRTVVELVQGSDEESISESVKRVLSIYGKQNPTTPAFDPTQGHGGVPPLNGNAVVDMLTRAVGGKSRPTITV